MDLLRLVMSNVEAAKLTSLSRLMRSSQFLLMWKEKWQISSEHLDFAEISTLAGDLSEESQIFVPVEWILNRAVFLRRPDIFAKFMAIDGDSFDFWYAISSGMPEIQAQVIVDFPIDIQSGRNLINSLGDCLAIPWTKPLERVIQRLIRTGISDRRTQGQLQIVSGDIHRADLQDFQDFLEQTILRITGGVTTVEVNEKIENIISLQRVWTNAARSIAIKVGYVARSGQLANLDDQSAYYAAVNGIIPEELERIAGLQMGEDWINMVKEIYDSSYQSIPSMFDVSLNILTERCVINARRCLADPAIIAILSERVVNQYSVIAGHLINTKVALNLRGLTGNPGPSFVQSTLNEKYISITGCKMFDPVWYVPLAKTIGLSERSAMQIKLLSTRIAFVRGQAWRQLLPGARAHPRINATVLRLAGKYDLQERGSVSRFPTAADLAAYEKFGFHYSGNIHQLRELVAKRDAEVAKIIEELRASN